MKILLPLALLFALASPSAFSAENNRSTSSVRWNDGVGEVLMRGEGTSTINGDKVELSGGTLYLNGQSYGTVPKNSEIKYIVSGTSRTLYVDGKARTCAVTAASRPQKKCN